MHISWDNIMKTSEKCCLLAEEEIVAQHLGITRLSSHLRLQCPICQCWFQSWLLHFKFNFLLTYPERQWKMVHLSGRSGQNWVLALGWLRPGYGSNLESKPVDRGSLPAPFLPLSFLFLSLLSCLLPSFPSSLLPCLPLSLPSSLFLLFCFSTN